MELATEKQQRPMGLWMALALVMGSMIGSGVFLLPASLAPLGWNSVFGWLITVAGALCIATVFRAIVARMCQRRADPMLIPARPLAMARALPLPGPIGFRCGSGTPRLRPARSAALSKIFPAVGETGTSAAITVAIVWFFTLINIMGTKLAGQVQLVWTIIKLLPLVAVIGLAAYVLADSGAATVRPFVASEISVSAISTATILTLWAMLGLETATVPADKVTDPERTIARATLLGTGGAGLLYIFVCSAVVLMLPAALTAASPAPFADFVETYGGNSNAGLVIAAFAAISALGALNGWVLCQAELPAAMARDGMFPAFLAKAAPNGTPRNAHLFTTTLLTIVILMNSSRSVAANVRISDCPHDFHRFGDVSRLHCCCRRLVMAERSAESDGKFPLIILILAGSMHCGPFTVRVGALLAGAIVMLLRVLPTFWQRIFPFVGVRLSKQRRSA